jgi:hypothetical protein
MHVVVVETGDEHSPSEIDHSRARTREFHHLLTGAHGYYALAPYGNGLGRRVLLIDSPYEPVMKNDVGRTRRTVAGLSGCIKRGRKRDCDKTDEDTDFQTYCSHMISPIAAWTLTIYHAFSAIAISSGARAAIDIGR